MSLVSLPSASLAENVFFSRAPNGVLIYIDTDSLQWAGQDFTVSLVFETPPSEDSDAASWGSEFSVSCANKGWMSLAPYFYERPNGQGDEGNEQKPNQSVLDSKDKTSIGYEAMLYKKFCIDDEKKKIFEKNFNRVYDDVAKQKRQSLPKSKPKKATEEQRSQALSGVTSNLAEALSASEVAKKKRREEERKAASQNLMEKLESAASRAVTLPKKPTVSRIDVDRLRQHIASCWTPPVIDNKIWDGALVDVMVEVDRSGAVLAAEIADKKRLINDSQFQILAESAVDALWQCSPLPLPPDSYDLWKKFIFSFDASFLKH